MLRLNTKIDHAMAEWFARLRTLPTCEQRAIQEAVRCGIRTDRVDEIAPVLMAIDPVLCGLWTVWQEQLNAEAWRAVVRLVFAKAELEREVL